MTVAMCLTWGVLFVLTLVAFWKGRIFISAPKDVLRDMVGKEIDNEDEDEKMGVQVSVTDDLERGVGARASDERTVAERPDGARGDGMFSREAAWP